MQEAINVILYFEQILNSEKNAVSDFMIEAQKAFDILLYYFGPLQPDFIFNNTQLNMLFKKSELITKLNDTYPQNIFFMGINNEDVWCIQTKIAFYFSSLRRRVSMFWSIEFNPLLKQFAVNTNGYGTQEKPINIQYLQDLLNLEQ